MQTTRIRASTIATVVALSFVAPAPATDQLQDAVRLDGQDRVMMECPLNPLLARLKVPEFEWQTTSNWKGYIAGWEVKDGSLLLVAFEARRDGRPVPVESFLPGKKLPVAADWYTGRVRIPVGKPKEAGGGYWGATFERVIVLHIEKGKVVKMEELKNARIKTSTEERAEREKKDRPDPKKD
ncbi:MAG TPA: hypothetical protein VM597_04405 [Gemmataceae bacterium]|jgi:hypothetical protein|nr:hypothetical protein [Gemmataceae bacterium]